jgi:hypothetical protein
MMDFERKKPQNKRKIGGPKYWMMIMMMDSLGKGFPRISLRCEIGGKGAQEEPPQLAS